MSDTCTIGAKRILMFISHKKLIWSVQTDTSKCGAHCIGISVSDCIIIKPHIRLTEVIHLPYM
jgi:hypothetical protein